MNLLKAQGLALRTVALLKGEPSWSAHDGQHHPLRGALLPGQGERDRERERVREKHGCFKEQQEEEADREKPCEVRACNINECGAYSSRPRGTDLKLRSQLRELVCIIILQT